jgi:branched-chain amino acid transport system permease protein
VVEAVQKARASKPLMTLSAVASLDLILVLALLAFPWFVGSYWVFVLGLTFANAVGVLSTTFLVRYGGEVSIGHNFFIAVGAYVVAIVTLKAGWPFPVGAVLGVALSVVSAIAFAYPSRQISGIYLAVATMALGLAVPELISNFASVTGGYEGLYVKAQMFESSNPTLEHYYLAFACLLAVVAGLKFFRGSRQGIQMLFARHSPLAAESFGTRRSWARISAMAISGALGGASGVLFALVASTVAPNSFGFWSAIYLLVGSVVSLYGLNLGAALVGAAFITLLPEALADRGAWVQVVYGLVLLAIVSLGGYHEVLLRYARNLWRGRGAAGPQP